MTHSDCRRPSAVPLRLLSALILLASTVAAPFPVAAAGPPQGTAITYGQAPVPAAEFSGDLRRLPTAPVQVAATRIGLFENNF